MIAAATPLAERASGLVVPAHLAHVPEGDSSTDAATEVARDPDGRRRIVLPKEARKAMVKAVRELARSDMALVVTCRTKRQVVRSVRDAVSGADVPVTMEEPVPGACGQIMVREDEGGPDPGFGCQCSRIHFVRGV